MLTEPTPGDGRSGEFSAGVRSRKRYPLLLVPASAPGRITHGRRPQWRGPWRPVAALGGPWPVARPARQILMADYLSPCQPLTTFRALYQRRQCSCARVTERAFSIPEARAILIYAGGVARNEPFSCSSRLSSPKLFCHVNNALPFFLLAGESLSRVFESLYPGRAEAAKRQRPQRGSLRGHVSLRSFSAPRY